MLINTVSAGASGTLVNGDSIQLRTTSSASYFTPITVTMNVDDVFFTNWVVRTFAEPIDLAPGLSRSGSDLLYDNLRAGIPLLWW